MSTAYRINRQIRVREVRLIGKDGENLGVLEIQDALNRAQEAGMDLVEVAPNARPPVARVMDYGKFTYEKTRRDREARKHQKQVEIKTIKFSPKTAAFHREISVRNARKWLEEGKKVKVVVQFKGREITYPEIGRQIMDEVAAELTDICTIEQQPNLEGWSMVMMLSPEDK